MYILHLVHISSSPAARSEQKTEPVEEMHEAEVEVQAQNEAPVTPPTNKKRGSVRPLHHDGQSNNKQDKLSSLLSQLPFLIHSYYQYPCYDDD